MLLVATATTLPPRSRSSRRRICSRSPPPGRSRRHSRSAASALPQPQPQQPNHRKHAAAHSTALPGWVPPFFEYSLSFVALPLAFQWGGSVIKVTCRTRRPVRPPPHWPRTARAPIRHCRRCDPPALPRSGLPAHPAAGAAALRYQAGQRANRGLGQPAVPTLLQNTLTLSVPTVLSRVVSGRRARRLPLHHSRLRREPSDDEPDPHRRLWDRNPAVHGAGDARGGRCCIEPRRQHATSPSHRCNRCLITVPIAFAPRPPPL